ncbi:ribosomal 40S subunit protein S18B [Sarracenia purpurea var. burkii]
MREGLRSSSRVAKLEYDKETEEDNANSGRKKGDGTTFKSDEGKKMIDLISADLDFFRDSLVSLSERKIEGGSELVERQEDVDINADASADTERIRIGGRRRERKRKGVESSYDEIDEVDSGIKKGKETTSVIDKEKQGLFPDLTALEFSSIERKMKGQKNGSDNSEQLECNEEANVNTHDESHTDRAKSGRGRRGRKRRMVESSVFDREDAAQKKKVKEAFLDGKTEFVGRILRSRTMERNGGDKVVDGGLTQGIAGTKRKKESDASNKRKKESDASNKRIIEMGKNGGAPLIRGKKKVKGRRGRPPKVPGKCGPSFKVIGCEKKVARGSKFVNKGKDCRLASYSCQSGEKIVVKPLKRYKHKEGRQKGIHRRAEMQLLKEQIVTMLKSAGWTIEYRPRLSKEYSDAVYISPQGTGCRSVTSAYRVIKQEVEEGNADSRAVSAFTSIPEEELSKLYRVRKKNLILMDGANKTNDAAPQKKPLKRKHSTENTGHLRHKHKEKQGPCARSPTRSIKHMPSKSDLDGSTNTFETGLHRSNRGRHNSKRYALLVRESKKGLNPDTEVFALCGGKRSLLSWMIDLGTVPVSQKVQFMNRRRTRVLLEGRIARYGILCDCCNKTLSVSDFEYHAGSKLNQPFQNIYLESGSSLLQCLLDSWSSHEGSECIGFQTIDADGDDPNDDTCNVCGDGGDLICCDDIGRIPGALSSKDLKTSSILLIAMGSIIPSFALQKFPSGDWHCVYCCCKFCGMVSGSSRQRDQDSDHQLCVQGKDAVHVDLKCPSFCGKKCREVSERLHVLLGVKHQLKEGFSWTFIQRSDVSQYKSLSSVSQEVECNSKLAVALSVLDECFLPIVDRRSGINMIRNVVYSCG